MPDPLKQTISATQAAALVDKSPYLTRWMLWHWFAGDVEVDEEENERMGWGKKMQPLLIDVAAEDLRLEVQPNNGDEYLRRGLFGCTRDAIITCPDRGPGSLETKCCFDYATWMQKWDGGKRPPVEHEIQLQVQMHVGRHKWGVIAAWCGADMFYFERKPDVDLMHILESKAANFFATVKARQEPDPFGAPIEVPIINKLWPKVTEEPLELPEDYDAAETARMLKWAQGEKSRFTKLEKDLKAKILAIGRDHCKIILPEDTIVSLKKSATEEKRVTADMVGKVSRRAGVRTTVDVWFPEEAQ